MRPVPETLRADLAGRRVCRANGVSPRVLVPLEAAPWFEGIAQRRGRAERVDDAAARVIAFGRTLLGRTYQRSATLAAAPVRFSCSSFTAYVFAHVGVWLPRYAVDQSYVGRPLRVERPPPGALLFYENSYPIRDETRSIGHVGIATEAGRMLHAGSSRIGVIETDRTQMPIQMVTMPLPADARLLICIPPDRDDLDTALDVVRWLQR